jgi:hypothetical protein
MLPKVLEILKNIQTNRRINNSNQSYMHGMAVGREEEHTKTRGTLRNLEKRVIELRNELLTDEYLAIKNIQAKRRAAKKHKEDIANGLIKEDKPKAKPPVPESAKPPVPAEPAEKSGNEGEDSKK